MKLAMLLKPWLTADILQLNITGLQNDSRKVITGDLFLAYKGAITDGRMYTSEAIAAGAVAIAYEPDALPASFIFNPNVIYIAVPHLAKVLSEIASKFYNNPTRNLVVTGVTGTNGKTTIAYQLAAAHNALGNKAAYIGTLGQGDVKSLQLVENTTPDALQLQQFFHNYVQQDIKQVCMEVSSHALSQHRVNHIDFQQVIYTNLSHEHLDYHHTMNDYADAKAALFAMPTLKYAVINGDDYYSTVMQRALPSSCVALTYGMQKGVDVRAFEVNISMTGSSFKIASPWGVHYLRIKTLGEFNIYNSLAVFTSLMNTGYAIDAVINVIEHLDGSPGRMEVVSDAPCVIIDYAHTPDALENVLVTLNKLKQGDLWVLFGCGGDRDRAKRPMMGVIANKYADHVIVTSDNPRTEDPMAIIEEIKADISSTDNLTIIIDRKQAILHALKTAVAHDIILIAGKGHETYQQIGHTRIAFSDKSVVHDFFR